MKPIRVLLVDDHNVVRAGIRAMLQEIEAVEVVGEANDGRTALELIATNRPDVLLADISMPAMNGLELTAHLAKASPELRVIILSMHSAEEYVWQALRAGAAAYLLKDTDAAELELAIQAVFEGKLYLTPGVSKHVVDNYIERVGGNMGPAEVLTPRQREILQLIAEGRTTKEIARLLTISVKTVETHRALLMERLAIYDVPGLVRYAMRTGVVAPEVRC